MSRISGRNTKPEMIVRQHLHSKGFRYRLHVRDLPGKPDIVLPKYKIAIQIHGCFWHGHAGCNYFVVPKTNSAWWTQKINKTKERDVMNARKLGELGWRVLTLWECDLKTSKIDKTFSNLISELHE